METISAADYQNRHSSTQTNAKGSKRTSAPSSDKRCPQSLPMSQQGQDLQQEADNIINEVWLKPGRFQYVTDEGGYLEAQHSVTGQWYQIVAIKIEK